MTERLALPTSVHGVAAGSNPAGGEILSEPKRRFIAQSLSCSHFNRLEMTEILLKGRKTLTHPSILYEIIVYLSVALLEVDSVNIVEIITFTLNWVASSAGPSYYFGIW